MTDEGRLASDPEIELVGIPEELAANGDAMIDIANEAVMETFETLPKPPAARSRRGRGSAFAVPCAARARRDLGQEAAGLRARAGRRRPARVWRF